MTTITRFSINLNDSDGGGGGGGGTVLNVDQMDQMTRQVEANIPTTEALYSILDEADAINITEVSLHSLRQGEWTIVGETDATTYGFELIMDVRHIGTISYAAITKLSDAIFKNGSKTSCCLTGPFYIYMYPPPPMQLCASPPPIYSDDDDDTNYDLIEIGISSNRGRLQVK